MQNIPCFSQSLKICERCSDRSLVENFCAGLKTSVSEAFCIDLFHAHFHANTDVEEISLHFLHGVASDGGEASTKVEDVVDPRGDAEVIEPYIILSIYAFPNKWCILIYIPFFGALVVFSTFLNNLERSYCLRNDLCVRLSLPSSSPFPIILGSLMTCQDRFFFP